MSPGRPADQYTGRGLGRCPTLGAVWTDTSALSGCGPGPRSARWWLPERACPAYPADVGRARYRRSRSTDDPPLPAGGQPWFSWPALPRGSADRATGRAVPATAAWVTYK